MKRALILKQESDMNTEEIKLTVSSRYGKFAETGGNKDSC
jgi:hypothetical protein